MMIITEELVRRLPARVDTAPYHTHSPHPEQWLTCLLVLTHRGSPTHDVRYGRAYQMCRPGGATFLSQTLGACRV
eukprot:scaffold14974_cov195-Amphora_coffeaeformis.AAC.1